MGRITDRERDLLRFRRAPRQTVNGTNPQVSNGGGERRATSDQPAPAQDRGRPLEPGSPSDGARNWLPAAGGLGSACSAEISL